MDMNDSEYGYLRGGWTKNFRNMRGTLDYGRRNGPVARNSSRLADVDQISQKRLIRHYLCDGKKSSCVLFHTCECLNVCKFGQRYLQTLNETDCSKE